MDARRASYEPALDGLRGISVLLVLLFHAGFGWASGGYVGVSVFFTLSGFLITRLLLVEHEASGRIDLRRFWGRRMRRLLPASLVCLLAVAGLASGGAFGELPSLDRDLIGALLQVANWFQLAGGTSYSEQVLGLRSPIDHFWSLAIEEQFYWLWPLAMTLLLRRRRPHRAIVLLAAVAVASSFAVAAGWGPDAAYWATPARAGEILVGAALAAVLHWRGRTPASARRLGLPAIAVIGWAAATWPESDGPAGRGWLAALAVASAALIAALQVRSPLRRALSLRPLVRLGVVSYGVYVYHWPIYLLLDGQLAGPRWWVVAVEIAVTWLVAEVSYRCLEHPIRYRIARPRRLVPVALAAAFGVIAVAGTATLGSPDRFARPEAASDQLAPVAAELEPLAPVRSGAAHERPVTAAPPTPERSIGRSLSAGATDVVVAERGSIDETSEVDSEAVLVATEVAETLASDVSVATVPSRPVRVLVVGDSTAWAVGDGLVEWAAANPSVASVSLRVAPGCGFIRGGHVPADDGAAYAEQCRVVLEQWTVAAVSELQPDVVMLMSTRTDVKDRVWADDEGVLTNLDQRFQDRQRGDYDDLTTWLLAAGVPRVAWIKPPAVRPDPAPPDEMTDPTRIAVLHAIIDATAGDIDGAVDGGRVVSLDLATWYASSGIDDRIARADGMHFDVASATAVAQRFVGPSLVNLALTG